MDVTPVTPSCVKRPLVPIGHIDVTGVFAVSLLVFVGHWLFLLTAEPKSQLRGVVDSAFLPVEGLLAALLLWLASRSESNASIRRPLWILAFAQSIYAVADASLALTEALTGDYRYSLFAHALFVTYYALTVFALLQLSSLLNTRNSMRLVLDMAIVIIASTMVFASLVLTPYVSVVHDDPTELITLLIYPALDLLALWLVFALLLRQNRPGLPLVLYSLALCVLTLADFSFVYQTSRDLYVSGGSIVDFLFPMHLMLVGAAAYAQSITTPRSAGGLAMTQDELAPVPGNRPMSRWMDLGKSLVPYVWVALAYMVLLMEQAAELHRAGIGTLMTVGFSVVLGLVIARQTLIMRDNSALAHRQRRLIDASLLLAGPMDLKRASERILREARKLVRSDETYIALFQEGNSELVIGGHIGAMSGVRHAIPLQSRGAYHALRDLKTVEMISNADGMTMQPDQYASAFALLHDCRGALWQATSLRQLEGVVVVPLVSNEQTLGALLLCAHSQNSALSDQLDLLASFGRQAAASVENARLRQSQVQAATSEERSRLSRELHDSVLQSLFGVALGMRTARAHIDAGNKDAIDAIDFSSRLMENAQAEMRALILELRPEGLINGGLIVTLNRQARLLCDRSKVGLYVDFEVVEPNLPIETKEALYRIIVEAINNVIRHANATQLQLRMTLHEGKLVLTVADNGIGFDMSRRPDGHIGIESMRERCAAIGASLEFHTAPGAGTIVRVSLDSGN